MNSKSKYTMKGVKIWDKVLAKRIMKIGLPTIFISMVFAITAIVDNISLGIWAEKGSVAIATFAGRLYWLGLIIVLAIPSMFSFLVSQYFGAKQYDNEQNAVKASVLFSATFSITIALFMFFFGDKVIALFIKPGPNHEYQTQEAFKYVKIYAWLILLEGIVQSYVNGIYAEGKMKEMTIIIVTNIVLNALLNYIFMNVLGMGRIGSAWSTLISWVLAIFMLGVWLYLASKKNQVHFAFNVFTLFSIDWHISKLAFKRWHIGLTTIFSELTIILSMTVLSRNFAEGGTITAIVNPFFNLIMFAGSGIASTKSFFVGKNLGAGRFKKAYEYDVKINNYAFWFAVANAFLVAALAYPLPLIYSKESHEDKMMATYALLAIAATYPLVILRSSFGGSLIAGGRSKEAFLASSIQPFILEVVALWLIAAFTPASFIVVYIFYRAFKASKVIVTYLFWRRKTWITNVTGKKEIIV